MTKCRGGGPKDNGCRNRQVKGQKMTDDEGASSKNSARSLEKEFFQSYICIFFCLNICI